MELTRMNPYDPPPAAVVGLNMQWSRVRLGTICFNISTHLLPSEGSKSIKPMTFPPGRERVVTKPHDYPYYYDDCYQLRHLPTRYGWRWVRVNVCG